IWFVSNSVATSGTSLSGVTVITSVTMISEALMIGSSRSKQGHSAGNADGSIDVAQIACANPPYGRSPNSAILDRLQVRNDRADIVGVKLKFRHVRMARNDPLAQGLLQRLDGVSLRQRAEQRRLRVPARVGTADPVATRAFLGDERLPLLE